MRHLQSVNFLSASGLSIVYSGRKIAVLFYFWMRPLVFFLLQKERRLPTRDLFLIYSLLSWPRSGDCEGCRIRSRDCCVGSLNLLTSAISTEPPQPPINCGLWWLRGCGPRIGTVYVTHMPHVKQRRIIEKRICLLRRVKGRSSLVPHLQCGKTLPPQETDIMRQFLFFSLGCSEWESIPPQWGHEAA
jgi:hypothetical protein